MAVSAEDDFGLNEVRLHYSVNGGPEKVGFAAWAKKEPRTPTVSTSSHSKITRCLAGDLVSIYATARDARNTTKTDMYFIQAEPFERNYSQSQQAGRRRGGGDNPAAEIISNARKTSLPPPGTKTKNGAKNPAIAADDAKFLGDIEDKLAAQANRWWNARRRASWIAAV